MRLNFTDKVYEDETFMMIVFMLTDNTRFIISNGDQKTSLKILNFIIFLITN
jgi:hypothetical protein